MKKRFMLRLLKLSIPIIVLSLSILFLYKNPGSVIINWLDYEIYTTVYAVFGLVFIVYMSLLALIFSYINIKKIPKIIKDIYYKLTKISTKESMQNAFYDIATGDSRKLLKDAEKIAKSMGQSYVTDYLKAKAALFNNDIDIAKEHYKKLINHKQGKFIGYRGLAKIAMRENELDKALEYTHQAALIEPSAPWVMRTLLKLFIATNNLKQAQTLLDKLKSNRAIEINELIFYQKDIWKNALSIEAELPKRLKLFSKIYNEFKDDLDNTLGYVTLLLELNKTDKAISITKESWAKHPDSRLFRKIVNFYTDNSDKNNENIDKILSIANELYNINPKNDESIVTLTEAYIAVGMIDKARAFLLPILNKKKKASPVLYQLMASIEIRLGGNFKMAEKWLDKSLRAIQD